MVLGVSVAMVCQSCRYLSSLHCTHLHTWPEVLDLQRGVFKHMMGTKERTPNYPRMFFSKREVIFFGSCIIYRRIYTKPSVRVDFGRCYI